MNLKLLNNYRVSIPEANRVNAANDTKNGDTQITNNNSPEKQTVNKKEAITSKPAKPPKQAAQSKQATQSKQAAQQQKAPAAKPTALREKDQESPKQASAPVMDGPDIDQKIRESLLPTNIFDAKSRFNRMESAVAMSIFSVMVLVLAGIWAFWDKDYAVVGDSDVAYNYGLVGGIMMLVVLIYALRKRLRIMRKLGDMRYWYYFHFVLGVVAPILIVLHTSFELRSINGSVAFIAMLSIVFSGFIGRYIYTRASYGLRTIEQQLKMVEGNIENGVLRCKLPAAQSIQDQITMFTQQSMEIPKTFYQILHRILTCKRKARKLYNSSTKDITKVLKTVARRERWNKKIFVQLVEQEKNQIKDHLSVVATISSSRAFEKLAARWRVFHVPILYLLTLSGSAHVLAVHMY
jgi:uncharacterized MnhB-related membrane protein